MTGDAGWNRIKALFQAAVELAAAEDRDAFLDQACGGDRRCSEKSSRCSPRIERPATLPNGRRWRR